MYIISVHSRASTCLSLHLGPLTCTRVHCRAPSLPCNSRANVAVLACKPDFDINFRAPVTFLNRNSALIMVLTSMDTSVPRLHANGTLACECHGDFPVPRVVDLSIVPLHIAAHTQASAYMIAEKVKFYKSCLLHR
ncbi:hypothetical protein FPV67DRAFT_1453207 [Lyophyllum atratum]|nr:hypothetical protein FPV67DRAFT_1453207 [Lyophyllum atratum]